MRTWALILVYFFSAAAFGQDAQSVNDKRLRTYSTSEVRSYIYDEIPRQFGIYDLFDRAQRSPQIRADLDKIIGSDSYLNAFAEKGREFLFRYKHFLFEDFGAEDVAFALAPEDEILRRSRASDYAKKQSRQEFQRTPEEAEKLALTDTKTIFELPHNISVKDLEVRRTRVRKGEYAYQYYKRQYHRYLFMPVEQPRSTHDSIRKFKALMIEKLEQLKAQNFLNFLRRVQKYTSEYELTINTNKIDTLSSRRIQSVEVDFTNSEYLAISEKIESVQVRQTIWKAFAQWRGQRWRKKDFLNAKNVYSAPWIDPNITRKSVSLKITLVDGKVITLDISEADFSNWINSIKPLAYFGSAKDDHTHRQYVIEAASRNAIYTNLISYLMETDARTLEQFQMDLQLRINKIKHEEAFDRQTLSEQIRAQSESLNVESKTFSAMWAGFGVHPDYWSIREAAAKEVTDVSNYSVLDNGVSLAKREKLERFRNKFRYKSEKERRQFGNRQIAKKFSIAAGSAALLASIWYGGTLIEDPLASFRWSYEIVSDVRIPKFELPKFDSDLPKVEFPDLGLKGGAQKGPDSFQMSDFDRAKNFEIKDGQNGDVDGVEKGKSADFGFEKPYSVNNTKGVLYFLVPNRVELQQLPRVYDVIRKQNLPEEILYDKASDSEPASAKRLNIAAKSSQSDFSVITNLIHKPVFGRVPIAVPNQSRIVGLEVRTKNKVRLQEGVDYKLYRLGVNQLLWIELSAELKSTEIGYKADYDLDHRSHVKSAEMVQWQTDGLRVLNGQLKDAGITTLAAALNRGIQSSTTVSVDQVEMIFTNNATYTYSSKMWRVRGADRQNIFRPSTKFVDEKGDLYYQCTGSNDLYKTYANGYYKIQGLDHKYKADNLTAYTMTKPAPVVTMDGGHYRTVLFNNQSVDDYKVVDATPSGFPGESMPQIDKKDVYEIPDKPEEKEAASDTEKKKDKPIDIDQYWIRANRPKIPKPSEKIVEEPKLEEKPVEKPVEKIVEAPPAIDEEQELLLTRIKELVILRGKFRRWVVHLVDDDLKAQKEFAKTETPGLQIYIFSRLVEDYVLGRINEEQFLSNYISISWAYPQPRHLELGYLRAAQAKVQELKMERRHRDEIIHSITEKIQEDFHKQVQFIEKAIRNGQDIGVDFVLDVEYRHHLNKISKLISTTKWGPLNAKYLERFKSCEHLLLGKGGPQYDNL